MMEGERILHVPDPHGIAVHQHPNHVKSVLFPCSAMAIDPDER